MIFYSLGKRKDCEVFNLISKGLGWEKFRNLVSKVKIPIYALGGMKLNDLEKAQVNGAAGIAGISMFDQSS